MRNVFKLFSYDIKHLFGNAVTVVIVLGLVFLPSIFTWYNVIACWNVFDNTGNLKVAVANSDEGYQSDLLPTKINVGDSVESALRANDQLDWVFTDEEDAIDGARSGKYYAAGGHPAKLQLRHDELLLRRRRACRAHLLREREEERRGAARDRSGVQQGCRPGEHHVRRDHLRCGPGADRFAWGRWRTMPTRRGGWPSSRAPYPRPPIRCAPRPTCSSRTRTWRERRRRWWEAPPSFWTMRKAR